MVSSLLWPDQDSCGEGVVYWIFRVFTNVYDDGRVEHVADINIDSPQTATDVSTVEDRTNNYLLINTANICLVID